MKVRPDWRAQMAAFVADRGGRRFDWREHNCALAWAADHVLAVTGVDVAAPYREAAAAIADEASALKVIHEAGFADLLELVSSLLPEVKPGLALSGDLAAVPTEGAVGVSLGIVNGSRILCVGPRGYATVDRLQAVRAWSVRPNGRGGAA